MSGYNGMRNRRRGGPSGGPRRGGGRTAPDRSLLQEGIYINDRFLHAFASCIGCTVQITVKNGKIYEGILRTTSPKVQVVLERAHAVDESSDGLGTITSRDQIINTLIFEKNDIVMITIQEVNLDFAVVDGYTDVAVSKCNGTIREKELQPWEGDSVFDTDVLESIEGAADDGINGRGWDPNEMFNINAEKFNIKSDYDPNLTQYTTPLHKSDTQEFRQREARAHQLAMEIERGADYVKRAALENGDSEEMMFSAVVRPSGNSVTNNVLATAPANSSGKYVVPQLRNSAVVTPAQRPQQLTSNSTASAPVSQKDIIVPVLNDARIESHLNGTEMDANEALVLQTVAVTTSSELRSSDSHSATKLPVKTSEQVFEELKDFKSKFKLTPNTTTTTVVTPTPTAAEVSVTDIHQSSIQSSPPRTHQTPQPLQTVHQQPQSVIHQQAGTPVQQSLPLQTELAVEQYDDKPAAASSNDVKESSDVAKKSSLNPLAKEFNPAFKPVPPRAMPSTTPPRPPSVPPSPVSAYPATMAGAQVIYPQPQVLVPMQQQQPQQQQQQPQHGGPRYPTQQQKRVTVSARGGDLNQPTQSTVINGTPMMPPSVLQLGQGPMYQQQFIPVGAFPPYRLVVQQPIMNMTPSHDPNMAQIIGSSAQPGMYLTQYTPQSGPHPPPMPNHGPSPQQQQSHTGGPTASASSGHQTPTPNQHTQYAMQQVGPLTMMPQSSMAQQQHMYHAMATPLQMSHQVVGQQQGATPQSPQVAFTSGPIPLYPHQSGGIMAFVPTSQPPQQSQMGPPPSQSTGMPPPGQHQGHLMMTQQTPQHPPMHSSMPSQMMMPGQAQSVVQNPGVGPGHQYVQSHAMSGAGNIPHPNMSGQHVLNAGPMYAAVPPHAMQQTGQSYQHGAQ